MKDKDRTFQNSVVVITGASGGIGQEIARQVADQGALLSLAARDEKRLEAVAKECQRRGAETLAIPTDVTDPVQCEKLVERTVMKFGPIDTLFNNAGVRLAAAFEELGDLSLAKQVMEVNYLGGVYLTFYALPYLKTTRGRIVGISSLAGKAGVPERSVYAASKHAMAGFFDSLRIEVENEGISVTMAYPDFILTESRTRALGPSGRPVGMTPTKEGRLMSAETCARTIVDAAAKRQREVVMSARGKIGLWLRLLSPKLVDRMAKRAIAEQQVFPLLE